MKPVHLLLPAAFLLSPLSAETFTPDLSTLTAGNHAGWEIAIRPAFANGPADQPGAIRSANIASAYLSNFEMSDGVIELDLRGRKEDQMSFIGVSFRAVDATTFDAVYFRPFNFGHADPVKRRHAVQYISMPEWPWQRLRKEKTDQYEKAVRPEPAMEAWFHARIVIAGNRVRVYVDDATDPSLDITTLNTRRTGKVGIWVNGFGDFANLKITK